MLFRKSRSHQDSKSRGSVATAPRRSSKFSPRVVEALEGRALMSSGMHMHDFHPHHDAHTVVQQTNLVSDVAGLGADDRPEPGQPLGPRRQPDQPVVDLRQRHGRLDPLQRLGTRQQSRWSSRFRRRPARPGGTPTGIVFNGSRPTFLSAAGNAAHFIFATEDGTIAAWNSGTSAVLKVDNSALGGRLQGPGPGTASGGEQLLYATNFNSGKVDVFDTNFAPHTFSASQFTDPHLPAGFAPFGIANIDGQALRDLRQAGRRQARRRRGPGHGFVDVFDTSGHLIERFASASRGPLNSPWGIAVAPSSFGRFSGDLLVGNFGDGRINAFKIRSRPNGIVPVRRPAHGRPMEHPIAIDGLWGLAVRQRRERAGPTNTLFFTAGIERRHVEDHGLFGSLTAVTPHHHRHR